MGKIKGINREIKHVNAAISSAHSDVVSPGGRTRLVLVYVLLFILFLSSFALIFTMNRMSGLTVFSDGESVFEPPDVSIKDSLSRDVRHFVETKASISQDGYDLDIQPRTDKIRQIRLRGVKGASAAPIGLEELPKGKWKQHYAIDLSGVDFIDGNMTVVAEGEMLFKCKDWNFTTQSCFGNWTKVMDLVPGEEYSIVLSPGDPGFGELDADSYYMFESNDTQYPAYRQMLNQTVGGTQYTSAALDLSTVGVWCWSEQWIAQNWTERASVNGTWNFTVYGSCTSKSPQGYLFANLIKQNSTGTYNFQNTTQSSVILCDQTTAGVITTSTISYVLPSSTYTDLQPGERIGVSYCLNQTVKANNQDAYLYWEAGTPSNVNIPTAFWDAVSPSVNLVSPANETSTFDTTIVFRYNVSDQNPISSCELVLNGTVNQTNPSVTRDVEQNFTVGLYPADFEWYVNCTDIADNTGMSEVRLLTINYQPDMTPPDWSNNNTYPVTPATYGPSQQHQFNVTWNDTNSLSYVKIEHNFTGNMTNYTVTTSNGDEYYYDYTSIAAGTYAWREYAEDNYTNLNVTDSWYYVVDKAASSVNLLLNGVDDNVTILQGQYVNATGYRVAGEGNLILNINGTLSGSGSGPVTNVSRYLTVYDYPVNLIYLETENYTTSSETHYIIVQPDNIIPSVSSVAAVPSMAGLGSDVVISAIITDNVYIENATAAVLYPNGSTFNYAMTQSGNNFSYTLPTTVYMPIGTYNVTIIAYDPVGNVNDTEVTYFDTYDSPPLFNFYEDYPDPVGVNQTIRILANVSDNSYVESVVVELNGTNHTTIRNTTTAQKTLSLSNSTGDCVFSHFSTYDQANTSDDYRSLIETGDTCGWNVADLIDANFVSFNSITVYVEHVAETGITPLSSSLYVGNATSSTVYGSTTLSTNEGDQNQLEEHQGLSVTGESTDSYGLASLPSNVSEFNNMQVRIYNGDLGGTDHRAVDNIYLVLNYQQYTDVYYVDINTTGLPMGNNNYRIFANDSLSQYSNVSGSFSVDYQIPPDVNITYPLDDSYYPQGADINFTGSAYDFEDGNLTGWSMIWSSDIDGVIGFGSTITLAALTPGEHNITLTATDSFGLSAIDYINLTIGAISCIGQEAKKFTLLNITVDGNMTDWDAVLQDPDNVITDGVSGVNDPDIVQTADKDLRKYAVTWNDEWLWMYVKRSSGGKTIMGLDTYFDLNQDELLTTEDFVLVADWGGSNRLYGTALFNYSPANVSGDPILGDGFDQPGSLTDPVELESKILGGSEEGIELEFRVRWSDLGTDACTPIISHISSTLGGGKNVPSQIEDNMASFDTRIYGVRFYDDSIKSGKQGTTVTHVHTIRNTGNLPDLFDFNITGTTPGYTVTLFYPNGTVLTDTDGDGAVDTGWILPSYGQTILMNITIPLSAVSGDIDVTTIKANSNISNTTSSTVIDTTIVGAVAVIPNNIAYAQNGTTIDYLHTIYNNDIDSVINVNASSDNGYAVTLHYTDGTPLTDTNTDTIPDIGVLLGQQFRQILVRIAIPSSAPLFSTDNTTIIASSLYNESGTAFDFTTIAPPLSIIPNISRAGGQGSPVYFIHNITYVSNVSGVVDITYNQTQNFSMVLYYDDYVTPLTDTDGDTIIDAGIFGVNGETKTIIAKVYIPADTPINTTEVIEFNVSTNTTTYSGTATDNVSVQKLVTYQDAGYLVQQYEFEQTQTVYAQAYALDMAWVYFQYIDPNSTVRKLSPYIPVDTLFQADDTYTINESDLSGEWSLLLYDKQGSEEITRIYFYVNTPPLILNFSDYPDPVYQGQIANFTANITAGELSWLVNETVVLGAFLEIAGVNYSMTGPVNSTTGIGEYYFDGLNTSNITPGLYEYRIFAYDNFTYYNISIPSIGSIEIRAMNFTNVSGVITDSRHNIVNASMYIRNSTGHVVWTDDQNYSFYLYRGESYNVTIIPESGALTEITYGGVQFPPQLINFTRLEDTLENETDKPEEIYNWTESIAWWHHPSFYFTQVKINFTYGADTDLYFWKCSDWNFDDRNCTDNNFQVIQSIADGPDWSVVYLGQGDPGAGAGRAPDYNESLKVWDVTGLNETERADNGTFIGEFYDLEGVNFTTGKSYRLEVFVTQLTEKTRGILRDPYYDNIPSDWVVDVTGTDAANITQINGTVVIEPFVNTIVAGTEPDTQKLIWDSAPPNKTVSDIDANDTVNLWFVVDIPGNASNTTHNGTFKGKSKGQDAEITNPFYLVVGSPPYKVNLTYPNNGNNTLINRSLTFVWEPAYDPDNQTLTYSINITSEFCPDIQDTNISATNYTSIYELGTYDECGSYNWSVRAYDGYFYGNWSDSWNFSIQPYVALYFISDTVDFGDSDNGETNDTTDDNPSPFIMRSDGNVLTDILNVTANQSFFVGSTATDSDFQIKVDNTTEPDSFNWTGSATDWINLTTFGPILDKFSWRGNNDTAEIDVKVHVPLDEPSGIKITGLVFYGEQS